MIRKHSARARAVFPWRVQLSGSALLTCVLAGLSALQHPVAGANLVDGRSGFTPSLLADWALSGEALTLQRCICRWCSDGCRPQQSPTEAGTQTCCLQCPAIVLPACQALSACTLVPRLQR